VFPWRKEKENLFTCMVLPVLMGSSQEVGKHPQSGEPTCIEPPPYSYIQPQNMSFTICPL
jgi:hypothetical protein